jgi:predicted adenylyl cyclase CyaB
MRDVAERDREPNGIIRYFAEVGVPMHNEHVESTKPNADIIIKNEYLADIEAGKSGVTEATLKFPTDLSEEGIKSVGAAEIRRTHQKDIYFNSGDRDLKNTGEILRIREEGERKIFTYKGPKLDHSGVAQRSRIEFDIDAQTEDALRALYIQSSLIIEKDRTIFKLGNVEFSLDRVEASRNGERIEMGSFIELRNNTGEASDLSELIAKLQLDYENSTTDAYIEIALSNLEH